MIQRIQTLFLFLSTVSSVLSLFFPMASFWTEGGSYKFLITGLQPLPHTEMSFSINTVPLIVITILTAILTLAIIFLYKKRTLQLKILRFGIMLFIVLILLILFFYVPEIEELTKVDADYTSEIGIYFPLISLVFMILANRFINKDEKLIRATDRLR